MLHFSSRKEKGVIAISATTPLFVVSVLPFGCVYSQWTLNRSWNMQSAQRLVHFVSASNTEERLPSSSFLTMRVKNVGSSSLSGSSWSEYVSTSGSQTSLSCGCHGRRRGKRRMPSSHSLCCLCDYWCLYRSNSLQA